MTLADVEPVNLEALDFRVQCESVLHASEHRPPHDVHWWASGPCGSELAVCDARRNLCRQHGAWKCLTPDGRGCSGLHEYDQIEWEPVVQDA